MLPEENNHSLSSKPPQGWNHRESMAVQSVEENLSFVLCHVSISAFPGSILLFLTQCISCQECCLFVSATISQTPTDISLFPEKIRL
jgi:hypothetical protein